MAAASVRSLLWGVDAALAAALLQGQLSAARERFGGGFPPLAVLADAWTFGNLARAAVFVVGLGVAVSLPLFWSTALCVLLTAALRRRA